MPPDRTIGASIKLAWIGRLLTAQLSTPVPVIVTRRNEPVKPLALDIDKALLPLAVSRNRLRKLIKAYTNRTAYWRALAVEGSLRHEPDGQPGGEVSPEHREHARRRIEERRGSGDDDGDPTPHRGRPPRSALRRRNGPDAG